MSLGFAPIASLPLSTSSAVTPTPIIPPPQTIPIPLKWVLKSRDNKWLLNSQTLKWVLSNRDAKWVLDSRTSKWTHNPQDLKWTIK